MDAIMDNVTVTTADNIATSGGPFLDVNYLTTVLGKDASAPRKSFGEIFYTCNSFDVTPYLKTKMGNIKYLPWANCWTILAGLFPNFVHEAIEPIDPQTGEPKLYFVIGNTCYVKTRLTIEGYTIYEKLAIMDGRNNAIPVENVTTRDALDAQQRCFVKNAGRFGLGLNLWVGEDYSENAKIEKKKRDEKAAEETAALNAALNAAHKKVLDLCVAKKESGVDGDMLYKTIEQIAGTRNPNKIKTVEECDKVYEAIKALEPGDGK